MTKLPFMTVPDEKLERMAHEAFGFLFSECSAELTESRYEPNCFGNGIVIIRVDRVLVRLVRDRGQLSVELGPLNADRWDWLDLERAVQVIQGLTIGWPISDGTIEGLARVLRANLTEIISAFAPEQFATTKAQISSALEKASRPPDQPYWR
jgi:hypothetical protein